MGHHGGHHHQGHHHKEEQQYGAYPGSNSGYYEGSSYAPPPVPAYGYEQQPIGYGGYGSVPPAPYGAVQPYGGYGYAQPSYGGAMQPYAQESQMEHFRADEQRHRINEHRSEAVALGAAAFAAYEHHEVKVDPEHASRHRMEERMAEVTAVGAGGYALYEHQQARHDHQQLQAGGYNHEHGHKHEQEHHNRHEKNHHHHGLFH